MMLGMRVFPIVAMAGWVVGGDNAPATKPAIDSGRYTVEADCHKASHGLECPTTIRDLVYDSVLAQTRLAVLPRGGLGAGIAFEGNPARGEKQRISVQLEPDVVPGGTPIADRVRILVEVTEGTHVVQRYRFVVPVSTK